MHHSDVTSTLSCPQWLAIRHTMTFGWCLHWWWYSWHQICKVTSIIVDEKLWYGEPIWYHRFKQLFVTKPLHEPLLSSPGCGVSQEAFRPSAIEMSWQITYLRSHHHLLQAKKLTHWGHVTHICVRKLITLGSDNGMSPGRRQAIIWTYAGILLIRTLGTNFSEILSEIYEYSFKKMHLKMSSGNWQPFCLGLNVLNMWLWEWNENVIRYIALGASLKLLPHHITGRKSCALTSTVYHFLACCLFRSKARNFLWVWGI